MLLPWILWTRHWVGELPEFMEGKYGSYASWLAGGINDSGWTLFTRTLRVNWEAVVDLCVYPFTDSFPPPLAVATSVALVGVLLLGVRWTARHAPVFLASLAGYLLIVLFWPFGPHRFVWSVWPLIVLVAAIGVWVLASHTNRRLGLSLAATASLLLGSGAAITTTHGLRTGLYARGQEVGKYRLLPAVAWVLTHTPSTAVISSDDETAIFLYTGRRAVPTSTFVASGRLAQAGDAPPATRLADIVRFYRPTIVITAWRHTSAAADSLTRTSPPLLRASESLSIGRVFSVCSSGPKPADAGC